MPSTARDSARAERRRIHRTQRARQRASLAKLDFSAVDDFTPDFREGRPRSAIEWMVLDRRAADKIGPLTRWALAHVRADADLKDAGLDTQVAHFARLLPKNLIGRHAVQHIAWALRYESRRPARRHQRSLPAKRLHEHRDRVASHVRHIIEAGFHGCLNAALRRHYQLVDLRDKKGSPPPPARYLLGMHDADAFATDVAPDNRVCALIAELADTIG